MVIYQLPGHPRSRAVAQAMAAGIRKVGDQATILSSFSYRKPDHACAVFYGLAGHMARALKEYPAAGRQAVYVDLGYWGRKQGGRWSGYHKVSVNGRHPTPYFQAKAHDGSRAEVFGLEAQPWRPVGRSILLCGMAPKGARAEGYAPNEWERQAVATMRRFTDRPVYYRPKPNWPQWRSIPGTLDAPADVDLLAQLAALNVHAVVSHHSNANVEALVAGYPSLTVEGIALAQSFTDLATVDHPCQRFDRQQWIHDATWCQWSVDEMAEGLPWKHLKDEGLVPS